MRIAFVGKGGSGKTTLSALFTDHIKKDSKPILVFDADLNIHLPILLGFGDFIPTEKHLSYPAAAKKIKQYLKGSNEMVNLAAFRKTTPPTRKSKLISLSNLETSVLKEFYIKKDNLHLAIIGTYDEERIGASCYHNNLAIFENVLSHLVDTDGYVLADMVAGVDAFANTLHAQFDMLCLIVEPTKRSIEVFEHYLRLATEARTESGLVVVANKIRNEKDKEFIKQNIPQDKFIGFVEESEYLREIEQEGGSLNVDLLEENNRKLLDLIKDRLVSQPQDPQKRLEKLWHLHKVYVAQDSIKERFGDLTNQIDTSFSYDK
jgi:CO dehydrogenase maturation factor